MRRPTITLAMIVKNEAHNLPKLLASVDGCFEEIVIVDTGSTDNTVEYLTDLQKKGLPDGAKLTLKHFTWIEDFAAARNYSYEGITTDFVMWMDADDTLSDKHAFIQWKNYACNLADYHLAPYNYAFDGTKPIVTFLRERVLRVKLKPEWQYFIHEGQPPPPGAQAQVVHSWAVNHGRTQADFEKDKGRNLRIFENKIKQGIELVPRMEFYYGKELFENGDHLNSWRVLKDVVKKEKLEFGDRLLAMQYLANAALVLNTPQSIAECIAYAHQGLQLDPCRAEFWCILGDAYLSQGRFNEAKAYYTTAMEIPNKAPSEGKRHDFIHHISACHGQYPNKQILKCLFNLGQFDKVVKEAEYVLKTYGFDQEIDKMLKEGQKAVEQVDRDPKKLVETNDIVFSTIPLQPYEWDDGIYAEKGVGGSETACIEMAKWIRKLTGRRVIVFNMRSNPYTSPDGVEYRSNMEVNNYFNKFKPDLHIAWRHNIKLTDAPTYLWCHDLTTQGAESLNNYEALLALSDFHKNYIQAIQQIPSDKILMTRNGIDLRRFEGLEDIKKNPNKVVFPSSPDRGLDRAIAIVEEARKKLPNLELHVYYGIENLRKYGMGALAESLEKTFKEKPWVKYHGNIEQKVLARELKEASVWLYPANFIESFCITALECLASKCFPFVRSIGALPNTLHEASMKNQALVIDRETSSKEDMEYWAAHLVNLIENRSWEKIDIDMHKHSWESVAREWIQLFGIETEKDNRVLGFPKAYEEARMLEG